jgi:hypothetical protein
MKVRVSVEAVNLHFLEFSSREILLGTETFATPPRIELLQQFSKNIRKLKYICHRQPLSPTKKCQSLAFVIKRNSNKN